MKLNLIDINLQDKLITLKEGNLAVSFAGDLGDPVVVGALTKGNKTVFLKKQYKSDETYISITEVVENFSDIVKPNWNVIETDQIFHLSLWDDNTEDIRAIGLIANDLNKEDK